MDNVTSWKPTDETPFEIFEDATNLIASTTANSVAYGVALTLFCICVHSLVQQFRAGSRKKQAIYSLVYISVMFIFGTIYCAVNSREAQLEYVNFRNFPGGPAAYAIFIFSTPLNVVGAVAFFVTGWMNDALLLWRLWVLYRGSRFFLPIVSFCVIMYLATFAMGMVTLIESVLPTQSFWSAIAVQFATAYYALTTTYTIAITTLMITRILLVRRNFIKATGRSDFSFQYLSVAAMIIESSALYTVWGIIFLALYLVNNPVQYIFLASLSEVQIIAPLLIIYRVSQGKAWKADTSRHLFSNTSAGNRPFSTQAARGTAIATTDSSRTLQNIHIIVDRDVHSSHDTQRDTKEAYEMGDI
ncbi:hypothetical protein BJ165DRAFT_1340990 [Panaeolus papilionaceus]|nr:hypothetical protein BJ165DRAFT_1340990 [Panaeolus papilionaceus]